MNNINSIKENLKYLDKVYREEWKEYLTLENYEKGLITFDGSVESDNNVMTKCRLILDKPYKGFFIKWATSMSQDYSPYVRVYLEKQGVWSVLLDSCYVHYYSMSTIYPPRYELKLEDVGGKNIFGIRVYYDGNIPQTVGRQSTIHSIEEADSILFKIDWGAPGSFAPPTYSDLGTLLCGSVKE